MFETLCEAGTLSRISIRKKLHGDDLHQNGSTNRAICRRLVIVDYTDVADGSSRIQGCFHFHFPDLV